jgi:hypothetical protein
LPVQNEKIIVFDEDGNPKELRYYEAEKLVARLGTILDGDSNFIGLRELGVEEVSPQSWFDKLRHKPQPKRIDILTVDFIGLINWINTIKTIMEIRNIVKVGNIGNVSGSLAQMGLIKNGSFETGDFASWRRNTTSSDISIVETDPFLGDYCLQVTGSIRFVYQDVPAYYGNECVFAVRLTSDVADPSTLVGVMFSDGTSETSVWTPSAVDTWDLLVFAPTTHKRLAYFYIYKGGSGSAIVRADAVFGFAVPRLEREDLLLKDVDFTANAALQSYLAAVESKKHKVYAFGYEADADGVYYFSATVNGSAFKFGRRITKGVYAQTLVHPVVCDANTVLNFMSTTGNSKAWIQYKTEA